MTITRRALLAGSAAISAFGQETKLAADRHRPKYHLLPAENWMSNPTGPIYWRGRYHIFYQHNPTGPFRGNVHWGHAVSPDMIHWRHLPIALFPTPGGPDKDGVFGGCCVDDNGVPAILYTGVKPEVQCMATGKEDLIAWNKYARNPVIAAPPDGLTVTGFRDPYVWRDGDTWYMGIGSGFAGRGGAILLYISTDLVNWSYLHPLYAGEKDLGEAWASPSFFPLGNRHCLLVSTQGSVHYWIGNCKDLRFEPESEGKLDYNAFYGSATQLDEKGERVVWGWIPERRTGPAQRAAGWSGVLSLPRVLNLGEDGRLRITPAIQHRALHENRQTFVNIVIPDGKPARVPGLDGDCLDLNLELELGDAEECGVQLLCSSDLSEQTLICYNRRLNRLSGPLSNSGQNGNLALAPGELLRLQIFVDCSVIEVFANDRACITERAYTSKPDSVNVALYAKGGAAKLRTLRAYEMKPISTNRMTT